MKKYYWKAMEDGELLYGMYTDSPFFSDPSLADKVAKPTRGSADAYALIEVGVSSEVIIRVDPRVI